MTKKLLILAGAMAFATSAQASNTFTGDWNFDWSAQVDITGHSSEWAGQFTATRTGGTGSLLTGASINTFCAELSETITVGGASHTFDVDILNGSGTQQTIAGGVVFDMPRTLRLEKLWGLGASMATAADRAAFQVAQWNLLFDTDLSLGGGTFVSNGYESVAGVNSAAQSLLTGLDGKTTLATVYLLSSANLQDQITGSTDPNGPPPGTTPEPFTMGLGLASAGLFVRRRLKAKKA